MKKYVFICVEMRNHSPKPIRRPFYEVVNNNEYSKRALEASGDDLKRFMRNNAKLLSNVNKSVYRQCREITDKSGFILSQSVMSGISLGKQKVCNTFIIYVIAQYWDIPAGELMYKDIDLPSKVA